MKTTSLLLLVCLTGFTGCATSHLAQKIRRDHRYVLDVRQDPDRVTDVLEAAQDRRGNFYIRYRGGHGPDYPLLDYVITVPVRRIAAAREESKEFGPSQAGFPSAALPLPRKQTRESSCFPDPADQPVPHVVFDHTKGAYPDFLRAVGPGPVVIHRTPSAVYGLYGFVLTRKVDEPSLDIALLLPPVEGDSPPLHLNICTPWRTEHRISGLYWRMLYPVTVAWDVVTFPVQAAAVVVIVATMPRGGWLF